MKWEKMSKSKGNGVDPTAIISEVGVDSARLNILFKAPPQVELEWDDKNLQGQSRWLRRLDGLVSALEADVSLLPARSDATKSGDAKLRSTVHRTIAEITTVMEETFSFNGKVMLVDVRL